MYFLSFFIIAFIPNIAVLSMLFLSPILKRFKILLPILIFISNGTLNFISVFIIVLLGNKLGVKPTLLMIIIPAIFSVFNNEERTRRAETGRSNVKDMLEKSGELKEYDKKRDVINEYSYYLSDVIGLLVGVLYFLNNAPFLK
jgi:small basic protein